MWKEYFKNLLGNFPKVTGKPIPQIINCPLGQLAEEEINVV